MYLRDRSFFKLLVMLRILWTHSFSSGLYLFYSFSAWQFWKKKFYFFSSQRFPSNIAIYTNEKITKTVEWKLWICCRYQTKPIVGPLSLYSVDTRLFYGNHHQYRYTEVGVWPSIFKKKEKNILLTKLKFFSNLFLPTDMCIMRLFFNRAYRII